MVGASILQSAGGIADAVLNLFYPPQCAGCGNYCGTAWCADCDRKTRRYGTAESEKELISEAGHAIIAHSTCPHEGPLRKAIHAFKYEASPGLASPLGSLMAQAIPQIRALNRAQVVLMPVPLHASRARERGYNQSERLARALLRRGLFARMDATALERIRTTDQQAHLDRDQRKQNMIGAFRASRTVAGTRVLLVDDVLTTGATLASCADALFEAGATHVAALTLARADL